MVLRVINKVLLPLQQKKFWVNPVPLALG